MSEPFVGEIRIFAGNFAPRGWAFCEGQLLTVADNDALFSLIGTFYGGDGRTTFGLPDLRGRVPVHQGTGPGLSGYSVGQKGGAEEITLTSAQLPAHTHAFSASTSGGTSASPQDKVVASAPSVTTFIAEAPSTPLAASMVGDAFPGSAAHENRMPSIAIHYIIALTGIYPSRN